MKEVSNLMSGIQKQLVEKHGLEGYSEQDIENKIQIINHWIRDQNSGRAYFGNIKNDAKLTEELAYQNIEAVNDLIKVRRACVKCDVKEVSSCPYDQKQIRDVRNFEEEEGLAKGTVTPNLLRSKICIKNCGKPGSKGPNPVYQDKLMRPSLNYTNGSWYFDYEACPVKSDTYT